MCSIKGGDLLGKHFRLWVILPLVFFIISWIYLFKWYDSSFDFDFAAEEIIFFKLRSTPWGWVCFWFWLLLIPLSATIPIFLEYNLEHAEIWNEMVVVWLTIVWIVTFITFLFELYNFMPISHIIYWVIILSVSIFIDIVLILYKTD
mgnify:CR=1 FL=1